jgi:hypothetical protein
MANSRPINILLTKGRHKTQPWTFTIDKPGSQSGETKRERYTTKKTAKRGALRALGVWTGSILTHPAPMALGKPREIRWFITKA